MDKAINPRSRDRCKRREDQILGRRVSSRQVALGWTRYPNVPKAPRQTSYRVARLPMVGARSCNVSDDAANKEAAPNTLFSVGRRSQEIRLFKRLGELAGHCRRSRYVEGKLRRIPEVHEEGQHLRSYGLRHGRVFLPSPTRRPISPHPHLPFVFELQTTFNFVILKVPPMFDVKGSFNCRLYKFPLYSYFHISPSRNTF